MNDRPPLHKIEISGAILSAVLHHSSTDQTMLGVICDEGFSVESLSKLMGSELGCTGKVEEFFENMLAKMERLRKLVEESEAKVLEQEDQNTKLRYRVSGLQSPS